MAEMPPSVNRVAYVRRVRGGGGGRGYPRNVFGIFGGVRGVNPSPLGSEEVFMLLFFVACLLVIREVGDV